MTQGGGAQVLYSGVSYEKEKTINVKDGSVVEERSEVTVNTGPLDLVHSTATRDNVEVESSSAEVNVGPTIGWGIVVDLNWGFGISINRTGEK